MKLTTNNKINIEFEYNNSFVAIYKFLFANVDSIKDIMLDNTTLVIEYYKKSVKIDDNELILISLLNPNTEYNLPILEFPPIFLPIQYYKNENNKGMVYDRLTLKLVSNIKNIDMRIVYDFTSGVNIV